MGLWIQENKKGLVFKIKVQPKASKTSLAGLFGDSLKIRLNAPPVDGAANKACIVYLSKKLGVPKTSLSIISGLKAREKKILVNMKTSAKAGEIRDIKNRILALAMC